MMTEKYKNRYRIKSTRLQSWNYGWNGIYFITICTKNREHYFGEIMKNKMILSNIGIIADIFWHEIPNHSQNIELGEFVVMPNHIHGIIIINNADNTGDNVVGDDVVDNDVVGNDVAGNDVETRHALSLQQQQPQQQKHQPQPQTIGQKRFQNQGKNTVSSIIGGYKSAITKHAHRLGYNFTWQSRFYDHIIRDEKSYNTISEYIINNPLNWNNDKFHNEGNL